MAKFSQAVIIFLLFGFLFFRLAVVAQNAPETPPPLPTPDLVAHSPPPVLPSSTDGSPHSPPPADPSTNPKSSPSPAPDDATGDVSENHKRNPGSQSNGGGGGTNAGKKAGIAVGIIIYKKRQDNIRRSQYGNAARRGSL